MGELDATHNGVRVVDDVVNPSPGLSGTTVAEQGRGESNRSGKNYGQSHDSTI
jgi:hypothetical protein